MYSQCHKHYEHLMKISNEEKVKEKIGYAKLYVNLVKYQVKMKIDAIYLNHCKTIMLAN